jgi:proteasome lid subunit RPN8/RPN11
MKKILIAVVVALSLILGAGVAYPISPSSFEDAEGIRIALTEQFESDLQDLYQDFSIYGVTLRTQAYNEFISAKYASESITESYWNRSTYVPWYMKEREFHKALRAVLKIQEAEILLLSQYEALERKGWEWLAETENLGFKGKDVADARAELSMAKDSYQKIQEQIEEMIDEDGPRLKTEDLKDEIAYRATIITNLRDYRKAVLTAAGLLHPLLQEHTEDYGNAMSSYETKLSTIETELTETEALLADLGERSLRYDQFYSVYKNLLHQLEEVKSLAHEGYYIQAVQREEALISSVTALNSDISAEINAMAEKAEHEEKLAMQKQEEQRKAKEAQRRKRNAMAIFFASVLGATVLLSLKFKELLTIDDDLRGTVFKELLKLALVTGMAILVVSVLSSLFVGPFPFYFFSLSLPKAQRISTGTIFRDPFKSMTASFKKVLSESRSSCKVTPLQLYREMIVPYDMVLFESAPAPLPAPQPSPEPDPLPLPLPEPEAKPTVPQFEVKIAKNILDAMGIHALSQLPKEVFGLHWTDNSTGIIDTYTQVDSEDFVARSQSRVGFNSSFYNHVQRLASLHKPQKRLSGDMHSHPNGSPKQSRADMENTRSFWKTVRNTVFVFGVTKGKGPSEWESSDYGYEVSKSFDNHLIRVRAYSGTNEPKRIVIC